MTIQAVLRMAHPLLEQVAQTVDDATGRGHPNAHRESQGHHAGQKWRGPSSATNRKTVAFGDPRNRQSNPRYANAPIIEETILINPVIDAEGSDTRTDREGCLSGRVERWQRIRLYAQNRQGHRVKRVIEGFASRVAQHECDHLNCFLFTGRLASTREFGYIEELIEAARIQSAPN